MKRVLMGIVMIAVVLTNCQRGGAESTTPEEREVVKIQVGEASFEYEGKEETPVPEVRFGRRFEIEVKWKEGTGDGQSLAFSDFTVVRLDFEEAALPPEEASPPMWRRIGRATLEPVDDETFKSNDGRVRFSRPTHGDTSRGTFILHGPREIDEILGRPDSDDEVRGAVLIFFNVELVTKAGETVLFDPPWAGKRGRG